MDKQSVAEQLTSQEVLDNVWELLTQEQRTKAFGWLFEDVE